MAGISDERSLSAWLREMPAEFACTLAARVALRVAPVLGQALYEEAEERRRTLILPGFRALAAATFASAGPRRAEDIRRDARRAGRDAQDAMMEIGNAARMAEFEAKDAIPEMLEVVQRLECDTRALGIAESAVDAVVHAVQATVDAVDAKKGTASPDAASESCIAAATAACNAVEGVNGYSAASAALEENAGEATSVSAHIASFWQAMECDARFLLITYQAHPAQK